MLKLHTKKAFTLIELMIVIAIIAIIAAIAIPNLIEARKHGNESAAIGSLKAISSAQSLFREGDKEGDGTLDYGTLTELAQQTLVDGILGSGTKQGYNFTATGGTAAQFTWDAQGQPSVPNTTGDRYFYTDHTGVIFYTTTGPISSNGEGGADGGTAPPVGQ